MPQFTKKYFLFLVVFLGLLSAFGPFVTDMYLPTLPAMAEVFHTTPSLVQMGLATSMLGLAIGQIFFGPLSDKFGRRPVLVWSLGLFALSTIASIYSPDINTFNACRFLQGLGGSGGIVLSRSVATDCCSGRELAKMLAIIGAVNGVAPVTAPVVGGLVAKSVGWQGIFRILFAIGAFLLLMCTGFRESHPADARYRGSLGSLLRRIPQLLRIKAFVRCTLLYGLTSGVLFAYISSASFIVQKHFGYNELQFALTFGVNAIGIAVGSALSLKFSSAARAALAGCRGIALFALLQLISVISVSNFLIYECLTFGMLLSVGFVLPSATTLAMDAGRSLVGSASAIFGATGFLAGGLVSPIVGIGNILLTTAILLTCCAGGALAVGVRSLRTDDGSSTR